jgi:hypothetical protein
MKKIGDTVNVSFSCRDSLDTETGDYITGDYLCQKLIEALNSGDIASFCMNSSLLIYLFILVGSQVSELFYAASG